MPGRRGFAGASADTELIYLSISEKMCAWARLYMRLPRKHHSVSLVFDISAALFRLAMH
jgi:hypothetical protein